ncbi:hypothetical protein [[Acholeplasma] multilocale]|uniref:hypothetical protein n=1 Tax=[Acholeplasma] multilocale TaxID=264638 RepID=UPI000478AFB4|nr:hypothetical protein [[Acholeplasma] multilocale]
MAKHNLNDITNSIRYDDVKYKYELFNGINNVDYHLSELLKMNLDGNFISMPSIPEIVNEAYPFIEKQSQELVYQLISRNRKIKRLIYNAVNTKKGPDLIFDPLDEKDKFIIGLAKSVVHDLNKFIYKHEITSLFSNLTFINNDIHNPYIGTIDFLATDSRNWFLCSFKTSRTSFTQKYGAEMYLQKKMIESNNKFKISKMFILNPRSEQVIIEAPTLSKGEIYKLEN